MLAGRVAVVALHAISRSLLIFFSGEYPLSLCVTVLAGRVISEVTKISEVIVDVM